jgi:hypothetical protein
MHNKKVLILTFAFLMPCNQALWAEEVADSSEEPASQEVLPSTRNDEPAMQSESMVEDITVDQATEGTEAVESAVATETTDETSSDAVTDIVKPSVTRDSMREHWKAREEQYQALKKRAEEAGVMLPESPPWRSEMGQMMSPSMQERMAHRKEMMSMSREERDAYRQQRYQEMRARADEMGIEMPETSPWQARQQAMEDAWAKHQEVIQGMSDEERAACHAMLRRYMGMTRGVGPDCGAMGHQGCGMRQGDSTPRMMPGYGSGYDSGYSQGYGPDYGYGSGYGSGYGPGYGYGYSPSPYAPQNFWDPNQ